MIKRSLILKYIFLTMIAALIIAPSDNLFAEDKDEQKLELTIEQAIMMALENNSSLKIQKYQPEIRASREIQERSIFDLRLSSSVSVSRSESDESSTRRDSLDLGLSKELSTGGQIDMGISTSRNPDSSTSTYSSGLDLSLNQPLFEGAGSTITLAGLRQAELSTLSSRYELKGYTESLISQVINAYLDYVLAERQLDIYQQSLELAQRQYDESKALVDVGKTAEIELIAAEAEISTRNEALINARSTVQKSRFALLRLINPSGPNYWDYSVVINDSLTMPDMDTGNLDDHIKIALENRPDLKEAEILLQQDEIDLILTKNGLLPSLNLFISLGMSGYANSFTDSISDISMSDNDISVGLNYSQYIGSRSDRERHKQTKISAEQNVIAFENMTQLAIEDVGVAWLEVIRAKEQLSTTELSRKLQEEKHRAENAKYRVGKSTSLLVAQAQRDLTQSQINEIKAIINYRKAIIDLYLNEGVLLELNGIELLEEE